MIRLLLLILLGFIVWGLCRLFIQVSRFLGLFSLSERQAPKNSTEKLVECQVCHTFIPHEKAIYRKNNYYCCEEHALQK